MVFSDAELRGFLALTRQLTNLDPARECGRPDLGDQLESIRQELEQVAFDIYDEVGGSRYREGDDGGGGVTED